MIGVRLPVVSIVANLGSLYSPPMATVRDQVEAYNYATRRQVLALLKGDDSVSVDPRRRLNRSLFGGLLLGVVVLAAVGVAGFLSGSGSTSVPSSGVIVDADSGQTYVRIGNVLHPTLNMTSAMLIAGNQVTKVSSSALGSVPRGLMVGIPGAPNVPPPSSQLTTRAWSVCTITSEASAAPTQVVVSVGAAVPTPLPASSGLVVQAPDGTQWLLSGGQRYQVTPEAAGLLGLGQVAAVPVKPQVLDLVPDGARLAEPTIPDRGKASQVSLPNNAHPLVGDLVKVEGGTSEYVVGRDALYTITPFAAQILGQENTFTVPAGAIVGLTAKTPPGIIPPLWPREAVQPAAPPNANEPFCITYDPRAPRTNAAWPVSFSEPARVPYARHAAPVSTLAASLPTAATAVAVPPGGGALVKAFGSGGVDSVYTLVTDSGLRFSITDANTVGKLGYDANSAVPIPLPFVKLLPAGPGLDPTAAAAEDAGAAEAPSATITASPSPAPS